jgi:hypothetical protein
MSAPMTAKNRLARLLANLQAAHSEAKAWGFALPSDLAMERAVALFQHLATATGVADSLEIAIGEDGCIEVTAVSGRERIIVDIPPAGTRTEIVVQDWQSGDVLAHSAPATEDDVVRLPRSEPSIGYRDARMAAW